MRSLSYELNLQSEQCCFKFYLKHVFYSICSFLWSNNILFSSCSLFFPKTAVFSTGGRDGNIMVWDTRCSKKGAFALYLIHWFISWLSYCSIKFTKCFVPVTDGFYRQVKQISGAHMKPERHTPQTKKRRGMAPPVACSVFACTVVE